MKEENGTPSGGSRTPRHAGRVGRVLVFTALVGVLAAVIGCVTRHHRLYEGPPLPRQEVARITNEGYRNIRVYWIDGISDPRGLGFGSKLSGHFDIEVTAGLHNVVFEVLVPKSSHLVEVEFLAEPGHTYVLGYRVGAVTRVVQTAHGVIIARAWFPFITDKGTGSPVRPVKEVRHGR